MSNSLSCVHPPSKRIFLATLRCFSVQFSFTFFRKRASPGSSHAPSFQLFVLMLSCPFLPIYWSGPLYQHLSGIFWTHICHVNCFPITENQCVPVRLFLCVDHMSHTSLLLQALSPVSTFGPPEPASSKLLFARDSIFQSKLLLPNTE